MKIEKIELRRFKSIQEVVLPQPNNGEILDNLIVLIGRNGSGKSNFLEALDCFFREFDPAFERAIGPVNLELWCDRDSSDPIEWIVTLKLEQNDASIIFGKEVLPLFQSLPDKDRLTVVRRIMATPQDMRWKTNELKVGNAVLIRDDKAVTPDEIAKALSAKEAVPANLVQSVLANLSTLLRAQFKYIGAARDNVQFSPAFGNRAPIIAPTTLNAISTLAQGTAADVRNKWRPLRKKMEAALPNGERIDSKAGQLFLENEPFSATGGGSQTVLALIHDIETGPSIVAIEEPENHLHPELVKKMLRYFHDITQGAASRQIFVSTHSPFMVDSSRIQGIISLYWDGQVQQTQARQIGTKHELKAALFDIGARPSDILFADLILIVEGESDKVALLNWARSLGAQLEDIHAAVIPCRGVNKTRHHLKLWAEISKEVGLPRYVIVDKNGQDEVTKVIAEGLVEVENTHVLERGDLEDYYHHDVLINALKELFGVEVGESDLPSNGRAKFISKLVGKNDDEWKVPLAERVSRTTEKKQIEKGIADFLRRIHSDNSPK